MTPRTYGPDKLTVEQLQSVTQRRQCYGCQHPIWDALPDILAALEPPTKADVERAVSLLKDIEEKADSMAGWGPVIAEKARVAITALQGW